jgi:hypothetical protein
LWWTRQDNIKASRPFVYASNFGIIENNMIVQQNDAIGLQVRNSPARVRFLEITYYTNNGIIDSRKPAEMIQLPSDQGIQWSDKLLPNVYAQVNAKFLTDNSLRRSILIKYSAIDRKIVYTFSLVQKYNTIYASWENEKTDAD